MSVRQVTAPNFARLRDTLNAGLTQMEQTGWPFEDALIELQKAGALLSVAGIGKRETVAGLRALADQVEAEFPGEAARH